jgi:hypothetical protein
VDCDGEKQGAKRVALFDPLLGGDGIEDVPTRSTEEWGGPVVGPESQTPDGVEFTVPREFSQHVGSVDAVEGISAVQCEAGELESLAMVAVRR